MAHQSFSSSSTNSSENSRQNSRRRVVRDRSRSATRGPVGASSNDQPNSIISGTSAAASNANSSDQCCRICMSSSTRGLLLHNLCNCRGSVGSIHVGCLTNWLLRSMKAHCELCGVAYPLWLVPVRALSKAERDHEFGELLHRQSLQWEERRLQINRHRESTGTNNYSDD
ncbi:hypothetical protein BOX15_Mlig010730g1 [Macrostomum lignano]|uniref:RING-CH-type domain-containing protein n=1 Tax=Macrostomum lignano TaxID=282301 RepID=A0A267H761_9PLAT|nr:hypothetical protein BOX15_Mlig010730g1 [Macrostomum lignano]